MQNEIIFCGKFNKLLSFTNPSKGNVLVILTLRCQQCQYLFLVKEEHGFSSLDKESQINSLLGFIPNSITVNKTNLSLADVEIIRS